MRLHQLMYGIYMSKNKNNINGGLNRSLSSGQMEMIALGGTIGVGGIDSWGADVEDQYQIDPSQDHEFSFRLN